MRLEHEETPLAAADEPRYDSETLKKVAALAQKLQDRHQQTFSAREMEDIGAEVGLGRSFIQRALAHLTGRREATGDAGALEPRRGGWWRRHAKPGRTLAEARRLPNSSTAALARAWWAAGWTLPLIGNLLAILLHVYPAIPSGFFLGLGAYLGGGIFLSEEAKGAELGEPLAKAWWGGAWTIPFILLMLPLVMGLPPTAIPLFFFLGWGLYCGVGVFLKHDAEARSGLASPGKPEPLSRAALLEMLFELQAALEAGKERRAFLSVDVVDSSGMKRVENELAVEHSFGRLHRWIEETVRGEGGEFQSAAGDGMMSVFPTEAQALRAARRLQEGIDGFNREQNRLGTPFRLRCGVSAGEVAIERGTHLGSVQSTVIDRAAALQRRGEPGSVVVDGQAYAAAQAELGSLSLLPDRVAGEPAFSWTAPVEKPSTEGRV